ncbi:SDR family oxidoreductase [Bdellovibrio sp. NC01]|uniref:SDR family oxidoreductase n=1 Tax=Bdellovibrio sp. NC01 TaxID=2220073 RepID=UPI001158863E|nr:SDR family oxidoreductase [Bdellovibrio sp. NC01]QDK39334.1 NAD(P)-dependent oxidoreductase [Bdellovibrio sp. NC01]
MIAVTGATGHLGKLVINDLLERGTNPKTIVALVRDKNKAQDLAAKGIELRVGNYESVESLEKAFAGVDKLLLISGSEVGKRIEQHANAVAAAKKAGVKLIAYTSITKADTSKMMLATEHLATEKAIQASGIPFVILRNDWYLENYTGNLQATIAHGVVAGATKGATFNPASRADYAAAAASVLLGEGKTNTIYELSGKGFSMPQFAEELSKVSGKKVEYKDMPAADYEKLLASFGLPAPVAHMLADSDEGISRGELAMEKNDLENLIHRPLTSLQAVLKNALA